MKHFFQYPVYLACATLLFLATSKAYANTIDILVLYVDEAKQTNNGRDINARIASYIEYSNQAYKNSDVDITLRLVGAERIASNYVSVNSGNLDAFRRDSEIARLRSKYGADLVTLLNLRQRSGGGYICGIGYVPSGRSATGELYSNAPALGFSLVGVDCGLNTFTHELGHNMSLGHSEKQGSNGGVYPWARGYGVDGVFSTVMAYPQAFGTRNQLPIFSAPNKTCSGLACGVNRSRSNGSDAAQNLNLLAKQIANFVGEVEPSGGSSSSSSTGGSSGETPVTPKCTAENINGNLIKNGEFNSLEGWSDLFNSASINTVELSSNCVESLLRVRNLTAYYGGAFYDFGGELKAGSSYTFKGRFSVVGTDRATVRMVLRLEDDTGVRYQYLDSVSVTKNELTGHTDAFEIEADASLKTVGLHIYGPDAGIEILADKLSLVEINNEPEPVDPPSTLVIDEQFEGSAQGWHDYFTTDLAYSRTAAQGNYSVVSYNRRYTYSGPGFTATGALEANQNYALSAQIHISSSASSETAQIWVYYVDDEGGHWKRIASGTFTPGVWQSLSGDLTLQPSGNLTQVRVHILGPQPSANLRIDNVQAQLK